MGNIEMAPQFIQGIDWEMLRNQKSDLHETIKDLEINAKDAGSTGEERLSERLIKQVHSIIGIIHLIDGIQDYALDFCELTEIEVFGPTTE